MSARVKVTVNHEGRQSVSPRDVVRALRDQGVFQKLNGVRVSNTKTSAPAPSATSEEKHRGAG